MADTGKTAATAPAGTAEVIESVRLATWNLWWQFGDYETRQPAIAETLASVQADVIGLQECWPGQVQRLADRLGMDHRWVGRESRSSPGDPERGMGNAVLSRWPIEDHASHFLANAPDPARTPATHATTPGTTGSTSDATPDHQANNGATAEAASRKYRTVLGARIATPHGTLPFFTTHLNYGFDESAIRMTQLQEVCDFVEAMTRGSGDPFAPVLCGDLNTVADSDEFRRLNGRSAPYVAGRIWTDCWEQRGDGPGITWSSENPYITTSAWPDRRIDYVLVGWPRERPRGNPISAELFGVEPIRGVVPSDHYGVVVDLYA